MAEKWKEYIFNYVDSYEYMDRLRKGMPPAILCVCINGGVQGKEYNSAIPEFSDEIAESVYDAYKAGASMVHIHARNPEHISEAAKNTETWIEVNKKVRKRCPDIIINNTTGVQSSRSQVVYFKNSAFNLNTRFCSVIRC